MKPLIPFLLLAAAAMPAATVEPGLIDGFNTALRSNKALVVYFFQERNADCARFERETLPAGLAFDAVFARQNASMDDANGNVAKILSNHNVTKFPSVLVFTCEPGRVTEIGRFDGFVGGDAFTKGLASALGQDAPAAPAATSGTGDHDAALERMLKQQGFAVSRQDGNGGGAIFRVDFRRGDRSYFLNVAYSSSRKVVWVWAPLAPKERFSGDAARLQKLLEKSWDLGPAHFQMDGTLLSLGLALDGANLDAAALASAVQKVLDGTIETEPLWNIQA